MSNAKAKFEASKVDVTDLLRLHSKVGGRSRGRRPSEVAILNKSAIIFCASIWEAYVEDVVEEAINHLADHVADRNNLPPYLVGEMETQAQKLIKDDKSKLWGFASKTLSQLLKDNAKRVANTLPTTGKEFNTAKTKQVSSLIKDSLGLPDVELSWNWPGMTSSSAKTKLDDYIKTRGDLAHGNRSISTIQKGTAEKMLNHIERLVEKTDQAIGAHLKRVSGVDF